MRDPGGGIEGRTMTCPNCQATTGAKDNFCLRCGAPLRPTESIALAARGGAPPTEGGPQESPVRAEYTYATRQPSDPISGAAIGPPPAPPTERMLSVPARPPQAPPDVRTYLAPAIFPAPPPRASRI